MKLTGKTITSGFTALWRGLSDDCVDEPALATKSSEVRLSTLNEVGEQGTEAALPASGNMPTASSPAGNSVGGAASDPAEDQRKVQCSRLQASARLTRLNIFCCELSGIIAETVLTEKHLETMRIATFAPPIRALVAARAAVLDPYLVDFIARHRGRETNSNDDLIPHGGKADTEFCAYLGGCEALDSDGLEDQSWDARWARLLQRNKATKCAQPRMHARHASVVSCESTPVAGEPASVTVISLGAGFEARCCSAMFEKTARWVRVDRAAVQQAASAFCAGVGCGRCLFVEGDVAARSTFQEIAAMLLEKVEYRRRRNKVSPSSATSSTILWLAEGLIEYLKPNVLHAMLRGISSAQARLSKAAAYDSDDEGSQADMMTAGNAVLEGHLVIPLLQAPVDELKRRYNACFKWLYPDPASLRRELEDLGWRCEQPWTSYSWGLLVTATWAGV
eukprot:INCI12124.1.p1 GENE.INCI12124.1~~INCI12124.1.p1  ORF type:complete len:450 (+),score=70.99 INCI12124.1:181-1530(+)